MDLRNEIRALWKKIKESSIEEKQKNKLLKDLQHVIHIFDMCSLRSEDINDDLRGLIEGISSEVEALSNNFFGEIL